MKKIIFILTALVLIFALFTPTVFAEGDETGEPPIVEVETETTEDAADIPTESEENLSKNAGDEIYDQILGFITNGEIWAKIGVTVISVLALILAIKASLGKICDGIIALKDFIAGKATKDETEKALSEATKSIKAEYEKKHAELMAQNEELSEKYDKMTAMITLTVTQLIKSPNARTEIIKLANNSKKITSDVVTVVEQVAEAIADADAAMPKEETPALDAIIAETKAEEDHIIRLG